MSPASPVENRAWRDSHASSGAGVTAERAEPAEEAFERNLSNQKPLKILLSAPSALSASSAVKYFRKVGCGFPLAILFGKLENNLCTFG
jgi:hypothetical protein